MCFLLAVNTDSLPANLPSEFQARETKVNENILMFLGPNQRWRAVGYDGQFNYEIWPYAKEMFS